MTERGERRLAVQGVPAVPLEDPVRLHVDGAVGVRALQRVAEERARVERAVAVVRARAGAVVWNHDRRRVAAWIVRRKARAGCVYETAQR